MKGWFTAREIADLNLPGLPSTKRNVNRLAKLKNWKHRISADSLEPLARRRPGKASGGGWEYHLSVVTEGIEPQVMVLSEVSLDGAHAEDRLQALFPGALLVPMEIDDVALINRLAKRGGVPVELFARQLLQQSIALLRVAA